MSVASADKMDIFGGDKPWSPLDWTDSNDTVRGGSSTSSLTISPGSPIAVFSGHLDTSTLGGAGFASQRTTGEDRKWDLSGYAGLLIEVVKSDGKRYTLTLKDELLPKGKDGREQSTVSWEFDFVPQEEGESVEVRWEDFKPTYRGREVKDAKPLKKEGVKRISLLMRSFFDAQKGDFSLSLKSISAVNVPTEAYHDNPNEKSTRDFEYPESYTQKKGWFGWARALCGL